MKPQYKLEFNKTALKMFLELPKEVRRQILGKIEYYLESNNPMASAKKLTGPGEKWRWRSGDYRIIFEKQADGAIVCLMILKVGHRRAVYR